MVSIDAGMTSPISSQLWLHALLDIPQKVDDDVVRNLLLPGDDKVNLFDLWMSRQVLASVYRQYAWKQK